MNDEDMISEDMKERFFDSKLFKKYIASLYLAKGIEALEGQDTLYDQIVRDIQKQQNRVNSEESVDVILQTLREVVEDHTDLVDEIEQDELDAIVEENH